MARIYMIGEVGLSHGGSVEMAHAYVDALVKTGVDAVKFQVHIAEAESSLYEPFRIKIASMDKSRMDYWKRTAFTQLQWAELKQHCDNENIDFVASPFSNAAVHLLQNIGCDKYKVGSGEVTNSLLLKLLSKTGKEIILSSGMNSLEELDHATDLLKTARSKFSILQCTSTYPTTPSVWGLNVIDVFRKRYQVPVGFSDHSGDIFACLAAASLGAEILEFHVVLDKAILGPDTTSSINIGEIKMLVSGVRQIETALKNPVDKSDHSDLKSMKSIFEKSLAINKNLSMGDCLAFDDLEGKKPSGLGLPAACFEQIIGRRLNKDLKQWDFITKNDLYEA